MTDEDRLWAALDDRLAGLSDQGGAAFWLRDDDAVSATPALDRLLALAEDFAVPLALAVIPGRAEASLEARLRKAVDIMVLQHGYVHADHSAPGARKCELGDERDIARLLTELGEGREQLAGFPHVVPMLVPPWNRIGAGVAARLPELGFRALSLYGPRMAARDAAGLLRINTHLDPVDWRGTRGFVGREAMLDMILKRLDAMALGKADASEPTGLLTHHLVHDDAAFDFIADLFQATSKHAHVRWLSVETLLVLDNNVQGAPAP